MDILKVAKTYRSIKRLREIIRVLSDHGFGRLLITTGLGRFMPFSLRLRHSGSAAKVINAPEELRYAMEELGPAFIKLGQMLASRPDIIPEPYVSEFRYLQDKVSPVAFEKIKEIVEEVTLKPLAETFLYFDPTPIAAASIGQVHRATIIDGTRVVVKVLRPGIKEIINRDMAVLGLIISAVERYMPDSKSIDMPVILDEFSRAIRYEMDLYLEASQTERIRRNFEGDDTVVIPKINWDLTGEKMMVMEEVEGMHPLDFAALAEAGLDRKELARRIAAIFAKMVLEHGIFHADLHAGNMRITHDGKIVLLDFGSVGYLSEESQRGLESIFMALAGRDYAALVEELVRMGSFDRNLNLRRLERDLRELIEPYFGRPLSDVRIGEVLREVLQIALRHKVRTPGEFVMMARSTIECEGVVTQLYPGFKVVDELMPYAKKVVAQHYSPKRRIKKALKSAREYGELVYSLPGKVNRLLKQMTDSRISIDFVHQGYDKALDEIDRSSNRISASLIISSLVIGSALLVLSGKGPVIWEFPVFGMLGFMFAAFLGFGLAIQILRSGKF